MTPQAVMATLSRQNEALAPISRAISLGEEPGRAIATRSAALPGPAAEVLAGMAAVWTVSERSRAPAAALIARYAAPPPAARRPARRARRGTRTPDRDGRTEVDGAGAQLAAAHRHRPGAAHRSRTRSAGHRPARAAEPRWGCGPLRTRALVDEDDDAAGAAVI